MEKYILRSHKGSITVYRDGDKIFLSVSLDDVDMQHNTFRYHAKYIDEDTRRAYYIHVKISTPDQKQVDSIKYLGIRNIQTEQRLVKETMSQNTIKFIGNKNNIRVEVMLPIKALTHKVVDSSYHIRRLGYINNHDKHGNCGVSQIVSGGLVRPK